MKRKSIVRWCFFLLAIALAFGSFNPLDLRGSGNITEQVEEQRGFTPLLFCLCVFVCLCDKSIRNKFWRIKSLYLSLLALLCCYVISSALFDLSTVGDLIRQLGKLFISFTGFAVFSQAFMCYPKERDSICRVFAWTCVLICVMFFVGLLNGFYFYSNGRLWLFGQNPNSFSYVIGTGALFLSFDLKRKSISTIYKVMSVLAILLIFIYVLLSGSRGTLIFLTLGIAIVSFNFIKRHMLIALTGMTILLLVVYLFLQNSSVDISIFERLSDLRNGDSREDLIHNAMSLFYDRPIFGYGLNGYEYMKMTVFHDNRDSHNMLVSILATTGMLGFSCMSIFLLQIAVLVGRSKNLIPAVLFIYVFLISMKTGGIITYAMMWFTYAVIVSMTQTRRVMVKKRIAKQHNS